MATACGITLVKSMSYRGNAGEEWSNTYWFKNPPPADDSGWNTLLSALVAAETNIVCVSDSFVRAYGYNSNDPHASAVFHKDWTIPGPPPVGNFPTTTGIKMAGDQAAMASWRLDKKNSRGKWIYLRKYFHHGFIDVSNTDNLVSVYKTALDTFATTMAGTTVGGGLRPALYDATITAHGASLYVTTRTLKRRGKRPRTAI